VPVWESGAGATAAAPSFRLHIPKRSHNIWNGVWDRMLKDFINQYKGEKIVQALALACRPHLSS